jgi:hypothetical protein
VSTSNATVEQLICGVKGCDLEDDYEDPVRGTVHKCKVCNKVWPCQAGGPCGL